VSADTEGVATTQSATDEQPIVGWRVWTFPNLLSLLRLLGVPLFLYLLLGPHADLPAFSILVYSGVSDWADGVIARRFNQLSKLGRLLDPAADRLYTLAALLAFVVRDIVPLWLAIALIARDVVVGLTLLVLRRCGYSSLQVHYLGKAATFCLLYGFPFLLMSAQPSLFGTVCLPIGWAFTIWGSALYLWAGGLYVWQVAGLVRTTRRGAVPA